MTELLAPPVYPDLDLRDFSYMPLDVVRLRDSEIAALTTGEEFRAAVMLWCAAWHQIPASSLPTDDRLLARLAGYGRDVDAWLVVKESALRGFVLCTDGRLYHPVIAEKATEADNKKRAQRERTAKATEARKQRDDPPEPQRDVQRDDARSVDQGKGREGNRREEKKKEKGAVASATRPPVDEKFEELWRAYPRRDGANPKEPARQLFATITKAGEDPDRVIAGAHGYRRECERLKIEKTEKVAQMVTWLRQLRWSDYAETAANDDGPTDPAQVAYMESKGYGWSMDERKWVLKPPETDAA